MVAIRARPKPVPMLDHLAEAIAAPARNVWSNPARKRRVGIPGFIFPTPIARTQHIAVAAKQTAATIQLGNVPAPRCNDVAAPVIVLAFGPISRPSGLGPTKLVDVIQGMYIATPAKKVAKVAVHAICRSRSWFSFGVNVGCSTHSLYQ